MKNSGLSTPDSINRGGGSASLLSYGRLLLRWGWFIVLSVLLTPICSYYIPDSVAPDSYVATVAVQVHTGGAGDSLLAKAETAFYAGLLTSPGLLDIALSRLHTYPQFKAFQLVDLQGGLVSAAILKGTNVIELTGFGDTPKDASLLSTTVYQALVDKVQQDRRSIIDGINGSLNAEMVKVQHDMDGSKATLDQLKAANKTETSQYLLFSNMYNTQKQRVDEISQQMMDLKQQGYDNLLGLSNSPPVVYTVPGTGSTKSDRMMLSPFVGLIMGLGGVLVASRFSTRLPLRGKKREQVLSQVATVIPVLPGVKEPLAQGLMRHSSRLLPLLRRLRYQASEHEKRLQLITVTSPKEGEGKSTIAATLAIAAAQNGLKTILVDANPRRPIIHRSFQIADAPGILDIIQGLAMGVGVASPIQPTALPKLGILPVGKGGQQGPLAEWEEPLRIDGLRPLTERLCQQADMIVFDGPSLLYDTCVANLVTLSDVVLLVVDAQRGQSTAVLESEASLSEMGVSFTVVLNRGSSDL